jgi:hypothetical protein
MRWAHEGVDFEPAGKGPPTRRAVPSITAQARGERGLRRGSPLDLPLRLHRIKGRPGKMSSSRGAVVDLPELLRWYQPEIVRYLFAGRGADTEFTIILRSGTSSRSTRTRPHRAHLLRPGEGQGRRDSPPRAAHYELLPSGRPAGEGSLPDGLPHTSATSSRSIRAT